MIKERLQPHHKWGVLLENQITFQDLKNHGEEISEEESWMRNLIRGNIEEESWRMNPGGGILE